MISEIIIFVYVMHYTEAILNGAEAAASQLSYICSFFLRSFYCVWIQAHQTLLDMQHLKCGQISKKVDSDGFYCRECVAQP